MSWIAGFKIVQLSKQKKIESFNNAIEIICGEANEAAELSAALFSDKDLNVVRRELARIMEIVEIKIIPIIDKLDEWGRVLNC